MLLTKSQQLKFWRDWNAIVTDQSWPRAQAESERHALLHRAGFDSLTLVDKLEGYSRVLKELAILREDLGAMLRADANPKRVLLFKIKELAEQINPSTKNGVNPYLGGIMLDQFGHLRLDDLSEQQLTHLRYTLTARLHEKTKPPAPQPATLTSDPF